jgi:dTMP kinase
MIKGRFITFEGGEGVGKSTQARLLAERLTTAGREAVVTREPGGTPFAEKVRDLVLTSEGATRSPLAEALLFSAARADHLDGLIRPALARGAFVISDRFADSTRAYQGAAGGLDRDVLSALETITLAGTHPDLTILLDLDPKIGLARANQRRGAQTPAPGGFLVADTFEGRTLAFHERLRAGFLALAEAEPARFVTIPAFGNPLTIADQVWAAVTDRLGLA